MSAPPPDWEEAVEEGGAVLNFIFKCWCLWALSSSGSVTEGGAAGLAGATAGAEDEEATDEAEWFMLFLAAFMAFRMGP